VSFLSLAVSNEFCSYERKNPFWPFFPNIFVKERNYSPQMFEKTDSKGLFLATASILGQPPRQVTSLYVF